jgi:hypothetical protein
LGLSSALHFGLSHAPTSTRDGHFQPIGEVREVAPHPITAVSLFGRVNMRSADIVRGIAGLLVSPLVPALLFFLIGSVVGGTFAFEFFILVAATAGYPVAILIGVPIHLLLARRRITTPILYFVLGLALGTVGYFAFFIPDLITHGGAAVGAMSSALDLIPASAVCGGIAGVAFWVIAVWRSS